MKGVTIEKIELYEGCNFKDFIHGSSSIKGHLRCNSDSVQIVLKYFFGQVWVGGKTNQRIRLTSAKVEVKFEAKLANMSFWLS